MLRRLLLLLFVPLLLAAKSYWYPEISTVVRLYENGDARIRQRRTYYFDGSFSWAFVDLSTRGSEGIEFNHLLESRDGEWADAELLELREGDASLYVKWGYSASYEEKEFLLDYTVKGAVNRYDDVAEFYWKIVEDEHEPVERLEVMLELPGPSPGLFKVYAHSRGRPGELDFSERMDRVTLVQQGLPRNAFFEVRLLAEPDLFPGAPATAGAAYERILREEKRNYYLALVRTNILIPLGVLLILVVPILMLVLFYRRHGREPETGYEAIYEHEPPRDAPPIVVPAIRFQKAGSATKYQEAFRGMLASLLGLAGKGLVSIEETGEGRKKGYRFNLENPEGLDKLDPLEREACRLLFERAGDGRSFTDKEFKEYARENASSVRALMSGWFDEGRRWWERTFGTPLVDRGSTRARGRFSLLAFVSIGLGVVSTGLGLSGLIRGAGPLPWVVAVFGGFLVYLVLAALGQTILRWHRDAYLEHLKWKKFREFLKDFSAIEQAPVKLLPIWEQYYVYAVVLGVAEVFLKHVGRLAVEQGTTLGMPAWFHAAAASRSGLAGTAGSFDAAMSSLTSLSTNFQGMVGSFAPSSSSGGGFSGGGGGGGGGGSSGAG